MKGIFYGMMFLDEYYFLFPCDLECFGKGIA